MRILHLSDIHIPSENDQDVRSILDSLKDDILLFHKERRFDLFILTGDIIDKGAIAFKQRNQCYEIFNSEFALPLVQELSLPSDRFYFVPGNHDVWRDRDSDVIEMGMSKLLNSSDAVNTFMDKNIDDGIRRILPFKNFETTFYSAHTHRLLTNYHSLFKVNIGDDSIGIACLNTAWRSHDETKDRNNLILGERQLAGAKTFLNDTKYNIALLHHPLDWLIDFDRKRVEPPFEKLFRLVFCGHIHMSSSWVKSNVYNGYFISVAPPNWKYGKTETDYINGYSIVDFDETKSEIRVNHRRFSHRKQKYVANNDLGDDNGISLLQLPTYGELKQQHYEIELASTIKDARYGVINEHLLTFNTDTKAPQDLLGIFVYPRIVEKVQFESKDHQKETPLSIENVCAYPGNQIVFGIKESGKTTLLDRTLVYFNENIRSLRLISVFINFRNIRNSKIETLIARFVGKGSTEVKEMISQHKFVILVDNISFSENDRVQLRTLEDFLKATPSVKMIATSLQSSEGIFPVEIFDYPYFMTFRKMHLKAFGSTETRHLIKNWFSRNPSPDVEDKVEKLLDTLLALNLPRTPLAISMFLWILEQQENYKPINNATMIENFIEKLFSKHARKEIYSDRFDYRNKERLLAEIACCMLNKNLDNYRISSRDLIDFIDDNLRAKKFDFIQAKDVLDHFLEKGILIDEIEGNDAFIRFRFGCFMHYFLMKKMDNDADFKKHVLDKSNFLMFTDEIDFYTGLKRDQSEILQLITTRMVSEFKDIRDKICSLPFTYDQIFESHQSIVSSVGDDFLSRLSETPKPTQEELDAERDSALEKICIDRGVPKKIADISRKRQMELLWTLAAKVLKNTEETTIPNLKGESYAEIVRCSMTYAFLWKIHLEKYIADNEKKEGFKLEEEIDLQRRVLPLIHQLWLKWLLGTRKLSVVFLEKIEKDRKEPKISDFEKYISVFLYSDIKGPDFVKHIRNYVRSIRNQHLLDMTLFKLLSYYYLRSKTKEADKQYENLIGDLIVNARSLNKTKKGKIIQDYRNRRKKEVKKDKIEE